MSVLITLALSGCKRNVEHEGRAPVPAPVATAAHDGDLASKEATWYRAVLRTADGVEVRFFLGIPAANAPGQAIFKIGGHEVRSDATFDGKTLKVPLAIHQTTVEGTIGQDGTLSGSFSTSGRVLGLSSIPLTATKVGAPAPGELATVASNAAALDLGAPRSIWRLDMSESGTAKLIVHQSSPGDFDGLLFLNTGNIVYLAGNGRGGDVVLCGFDGTAGYRVELALGADRTRASGKFFGSHRLDWRETLTATRGEDFALALKPKAAGPRTKVGLPDSPELAALGSGPLMVEIAGSWCSTCRSAAPFLVELHRDYQARGLHMVTLLYELTDDRAIDAKQAEAFKKTYGVTWPVVPVSGGLDSFSEIVPSGLSDLDPGGFPITLFLAADRTLLAFHAGFPAADAPDEFHRVAAEFRANIETLLASPIDARRAPE